jgi:glycosyltransferase involved in cell wall biosynthesis
MKLLTVIPSLGLTYGGTSKAVIELVEALGSQGVEVDVVTTTADGSTRLQVQTQIWHTKEYYRVQYFPYWGIQDYKVSGTLSKWLFQNIKGYDLVQTHAIFSIPNLPAYWACQRNQVPYIVVPHGMLEPWALSYKGWKKRFYYNLFEKSALQSASAIQALASSEAEQLKLLGLNLPTFVASNGVNRQDFEKLPDPELFYQKFPQTRDKTLILFLGRIDPKKGLDLLAAAFRRVHEQFLNTHLIVAGPDNVGFLPVVQDYFTNAGCIDAVTFTGMLTDTIKCAALAAADLYVAPSYSEGFSMSVLEGMASGLPCVITKECNFPEAAAAKAAYVVDVDASAIAEAIIQCLEEPEKARAMGEHARQFILARYTWDKIATNLINTYSSIIKTM